MMCVAHTRRCLGITASPTGYVIGSLKIKENGQIHDLRKTLPLGKFICPLMSDFEVLECDALFILVVEKLAYYSSLIESNIHNQLDCILLTAQGMPDMATRYFLRNLTKKVKLPVFGLFDCDTGGINILCAYTCGCENSAFDSDNLVTPGIHWLGLKPSDLDEYNIQGTESIQDGEKLKKLMDKDFLRDKHSWTEELKRMCKEMRKCDLDRLKYGTLLKKLALKDWLNNEVQFTSKIQPNGSLHRLDIPRGQKMLNLWVVKSETATIKIPELELEILPNAQRESFSTVKGILLRELKELQAFKNERMNVDPETEESIDRSIRSLQQYATGESSFTFILDDPAGNSSIEQPELSNSRNSAFDIEFYGRSREQQASLGYPTEWSELIEDGCSLLSLELYSCCYLNSKFKSSGAIPPKGKKVSLYVKDITDLRRIVKKSDTASVIIPEIDLELTSGLFGGVETTVKGLVIKISEALKGMKFYLLGSEKFIEDINGLIAKLNKILTVEEPWTLIIDDARGHSSIATACYDIKDDQQLTIEEYERSFEQKEELGFNDMDTSSADADYDAILSIQQVYLGFDRPTEGPGPTTIPESDQTWLNVIRTWSPDMQLNRMKKGVQSVITKVKARQILDSRGIPTVEVDLYTNKGMFRASAPSATPSRLYEAIELRDGDKGTYLGNGVTRAVRNINDKISEAIIGMDPTLQNQIDQAMINLDKTERKGELGGNAILAVSITACRAGAAEKKVPLYKHIADLSGKGTQVVLPVPAFTLISGGKHAANNLALRGILILPIGARRFEEAMQMGSETYHHLKAVITEKYGSHQCNVGEDGGFAPDISSCREALELVKEAINRTVYNDKIKIAIDVAATDIFIGTKYDLNYKSPNTSGQKFKSGEDMVEMYTELCNDYPIVSIEDPFDMEGWEQVKYFSGLGICQVVGDGLLMLNSKRIERAIREHACNALLLKINQIGTVTEAIEVVKMAKDAQWGVVISQRSGETNDSFIADLSVGLATGQIKAGAPCRGERLAKYNQLIRIEEELGDQASYVGDDWRQS